MRHGPPPARRSSRALLASALAALFTVAMAADAGPARAGCFPWKCCDSWGFDYPGVHVTKKGCQNDGGTVQCSARCSNASFPFSCCDADGYPFPGTYLGQHECKVAGGTPFAGRLFCPNASDVAFQCCDPAGGSAPRVYAFRENCRDDGYVVQEDWKVGGCPGGLIDQAKEFVHSVLNAHQCSLDTYHHYLEPKASSIMKGWETAYASAHPGDHFSDKDEHCIMNCLLTVRCGRPAAALAGWARETLQMCDGKPFNAWGFGDECANFKGRVYGDSLPDGDANYESECVSYCSSYPNLESVCEGPLQDLVEAYAVVPAIMNPDPDAPPALTQLKDLVISFHALLPDEWQTLSKKCDSLANGGGLTYGDGLSQAETLQQVKALGMAIVAATDAAAGHPLAVGETGIYDDGAALVEAPEDGVHTLITDLPSDQMVLVLSLKDAAVSTLELRSADGKSLILTMADPVETSCDAPPCEHRLPFSQWTVAREATPSISQ